MALTSGRQCPPERNRAPPRGVRILANRRQNQDQCLWRSGMAGLLACLPSLVQCWSNDGTLDSRCCTPTDYRCVWFPVEGDLNELSRVHWLEAEFGGNLFDE